MELANWLEEQSDFTEDFGLDREMSIYKYMVISPMRTKSYYTRFSYPHSIQNVPIQSGLFKGTYSAHGYELISLEYEDGATKMKAIKITVGSRLKPPMLLASTKTISLFRATPTYPLAKLHSGRTYLTVCT